MDLKQSAIAWVQSLVKQWQRSGRKAAKGKPSGGAKKRQSAVTMALNKKRKTRARKRPAKVATAPA